VTFRRACRSGAPWKVFRAGYSPVLTRLWQRVVMGAGQAGCWPSRPRIPREHSGGVVVMGSRRL